MYIVIDKNGFAKYATLVQPTEDLYTDIPLPYGMIKGQLIKDVWIETGFMEVPKTVKKLSFKLALIESGISTSIITNTIYAMPDSLQKDKIITLWEDSTFFEREDALLISMADNLKITTQQLDAIFILAESLE